MKNKFLLCPLATALAACGFTVTKVFAADGPAAAPARGHFMKRVAEKLNLTGDQRTQIKAVRAGEKSTLTLLLTAMHETRTNLRVAIRANDANETSVRAASAKAAAAEADLAVERMKLFGKIAPILTDAQRVEDLAQETFVKLWRALEQFDARAPFEQWISRIAVRTALDHLRKERRRQNEIALPELGDDALDWLRNADEKNRIGRA